MKRLIQFIFLGSIILWSCTPKTIPSITENTSAFRNASLAPFYHGVASGDPLPNQVIIWTRITPTSQNETISGRWEIAKDPEFTKYYQAGDFSTTSDRDWTVKVDVNNLDPGTFYYYRFKTLNKISPVGRTKTAAQDTESLQFAVASCSNYEFGYFNAYGLMAKEDLDAVIHLGDYIYEYAQGVYGDTTIGRKHIPNKEIITLQDYRDRYSQYRLDPDLQEAHQMHPFITIWDDHEITNNAYRDGAQNHQENEGSYEERKRVAKQVYYEWLPIREGDEHYRNFSFGKLAQLTMLDERLAGRTMQADSLGDPVLMQGSSSMLGAEQFGWLANQLTNDEVQWKLIGNQVIFSYCNWGFPTFTTNLDAWDGYPIEQQKLSSLIKNNRIDNVVFLTGDTHSSWAFEVVTSDIDQYDPSTSDGAFAVEFGVPSINSGNSNERASTEQVLEHEKKIVGPSFNPHLKYVNMRDHGFVKLDVDQNEVVATYMYTETLRERTLVIKPSKRIKVVSGSHQLVDVEQ